MKQTTAEDVRKLREETGEGLMACKKIHIPIRNTLSYFG